MKFVLVMLLYNQYGKSVTINIVEGFSSVQACQVAGQEFKKIDSGDYLNQFVCLEVK